MAQGKIEAELVKATGLKRKPRETDQEFGKRLAQKCDDLDDKVWKRLSEGAQEWVGEAMKVLNANEENKTDDPVPPIDEAEEEEARPRRTSGRAAAAAKTAEKDDEDEDEDKPAPRRGRAAAAAKSNGKDEEEAPARGRGRTAAAKTAVEPAAKTSSRPRQTNKDGTPLVVRIKQILLDNLSMPVADLMSKLEKEGYTPSLASTTTIRSDFRHSVRVLKEEGVNLKQLSI